MYGMPIFNNGRQLERGSFFKRAVVTLSWLKADNIIVQSMRIIWCFRKVEKTDILFSKPSYHETPQRPPLGHIRIR